MRALVTLRMRRTLVVLRRGGRGADGGERGQPAVALGEALGDEEEVAIGRAEREAAAVGAPAPDRTRAPLAAARQRLARRVPLREQVAARRVLQAAAVAAVAAAAAVARSHAPQALTQLLVHVTNKFMYSRA